VNDIAAQVDLFHPADRVWRALTDPELLSRWFTEVSAVPDAPGRLRFATSELPGFDAAVEAEVVERREPELMTLRCREGGRRSLLTGELTPTAEGCRLSMREVIEEGEWSAAQRDAREQSYQQALTNRLPAILDWYAFQQVDLRRGDAGMTAELPVVAWAGGEPRRRRRAVVLVGAGVGVLLAGGATAWALRPEPPRQPVAQATSTPTPTASVSAAASPRPASAATATRQARPTSGSPSPSRSASPRPSRTPASSAPPPAAPTLSARYETVSSRLLGYSAEVVVTNPGTVASDGWTLVVTFADDSEVAKVNGAEWRQEGRTVTFTGAPLPAGGAQTVRFDVRDSAAFAKGPESCTIGDRPCEGL